MLHAIDRQQMVDTLEAGLSTVSHAWVQPTDPEFADLERAITRYGFDPGRAQQLIEGMGYAKAADGVYRDGQGQRLTVEIRANETNAILPKAMLSVADYWQRIGVAVDPVIIPRQQAQDRLYRATFPAFELVRGASDLSAFRILHSSEVRRSDNSYSGSNSAGYANEEFDSLVDRWQMTIPQRERMQLVDHMIRKITEEVVVMGLFYDIEPTAIAAGVQHVSARPRGSTTQAWNAHEWDVR
jgi:peptide/nickel transport system substrate-binding protein